MNNPAVETLLKKRLDLLLELEIVSTDIKSKIGSIETAIEQLSGKKVWEASQDEFFDDESPNYIKSSIED